MFHYIVFDKCSRVILSKFWSCPGLSNKVQCIFDVANLERLCSKPRIVY